MTLDNETAKLFGFIIWAVLVVLGFLKKLRSNLIIIALLFITGLIGLYPLTLKLQGLHFDEHIRPSDTLFMPFVYIKFTGS
jgi:hypothetical protein